MKFLSHYLLLPLLFVMPAMGATAAGNPPLPEGIQEGNILHCFCWRATDIIDELPAIAEAGFGAVQISPVQGSCNDGDPWYKVYVPYDYKLIGNAHCSPDELRQLCAEAKNYGIKIIVDIVANHINGTTYDPFWDNEDYQRWLGDINYAHRENVIHMQLVSGCCDVVTENPDVQARARAYVDELREAGVSGIRWDAAKHIGLPSDGDNFWPTVCEGSGLYHYGEILGYPAGGDPGRMDLFTEYSQYMSLTDADVSSWVLESFKALKVPGSLNYLSPAYVAADHLVCWGESHDTYSNVNAASVGVDQNVVDRAWALVACRDGMTSLYFSRPSETGYNTIKIAIKGSTHFKDPEIAEVNHFRNAMTGKAEAYAVKDNVGCLARKDGGAVIVRGEGGNVYTTVPNPQGYCPAGTYIDRVSGNLFTVTADMISGKVGPTGIAVLRDAEQNLPTVELTKDGGRFYSESLTVGLSLSPLATQGWYSIDGAPEVEIKDQATVTIGQPFGGVPERDFIIAWRAVNADGREIKSECTFTRVDPAYGVFAYFDSSVTGWTSVNCYMYSSSTQNAAWPGEPMAQIGDNLWIYEVPENMQAGARLLFNNGEGQQYPASGVNGLPIEDRSMICNGSEWEAYGDTPLPYPVPDGFVVLWDNSESLSWTVPHIHYWGVEGSSTTWPGIKMERLKGDLWYAELPATCTGVVFSQGVPIAEVGVSQTADIKPVSHHVYSLVSGDRGVYPPEDTNLFTIPLPTPNTQSRYYNLLGIPVDNPTSGLYIRDGRKVFIP